MNYPTWIYFLVVKCFRYFFWSFSLVLSFLSLSFFTCSIENQLSSGCNKLACIYLLLLKQLRTMKKIHKSKLMNVSIFWPAIFIVTVFVLRCLITFSLSFSLIQFLTVSLLRLSFVFVLKLLEWLLDAKDEKNNKKQLIFWNFVTKIIKWILLHASNFCLVITISSSPLHPAFLFGKSYLRRKQKKKCLILRV